MNRVFSSSVTSTNLRRYYEGVCPVEELVRWLTYGGTLTLSTRVFAFSVLDERKNSNFVIRPVSMKHEKSALRRAMLDKVPYRVDIGGNYCIPASRRFVSSIPMGIPIEQREIVFDIDMSPPVNWKMIKDFMRILDHDLRKYFGFNHILFIFSGKKGIHCWVCDEEARQYTATNRSNLAQYFKKKIPYLDFEVTEQIGHMIKMPFSVHPETGKLCVPIDINLLDAFEPDLVPTLDSPSHIVQLYVEYFTNSFLKKLLSRGN